MGRGVRSLKKNDTATKTAQLIREEAHLWPSVSAEAARKSSSFPSLSSASVDEREKQSGLWAERRAVGVLRLSLARPLRSLCFPILRLSVAKALKSHQITSPHTNKMNNKMQCILPVLHTVAGLGSSLPLVTTCDVVAAVTPPPGVRGGTSTWAGQI